MPSSSSSKDASPSGVSLFHTHWDEEHGEGQPIPPFDVTSSPFNLMCKESSVPERIPLFPSHDSSSSLREDSSLPGKIPLSQKGFLYPRENSSLPERIPLSQSGLLSPKEDSIPLSQRGGLLLPRTDSSLPDRIPLSQRGFLSPERIPLSQKRDSFLSERIPVSQRGSSLPRGSLK